MGPLLICAIFSMIGFAKMTTMTKQYKLAILPERYEELKVKSDSNDHGNSGGQYKKASTKQNCLEDVRVPKTITRTIPNVIHFIVQSKCLPEEIANAHIKNWEAIDHHSIMYHDQNSIDAYMSIVHKDFPAAAATYKCAQDPLAKMDLAKLMLLWDHGGIAVDIGHIMGPAFENGNLIQDRDQCVFEVDGDLAANPRFLACKPKHTALYAAIVKCITLMPFVDDYQPQKYTWEKRSHSIGFARTFMTMVKSDDGNVKIKGQFEGDEIVQINATAINGDLFTSLPMSNETVNEIRLSAMSREDQEQCQAILRNDSYKVDVKSLLDLVEYGKKNETCSRNLKFFKSKFDERSISEGRKIPKIVHMTSKSQCFADEFVEVMNKWAFKEHSIFIHDDAAVDKLLSREWPEFPMLQEVRSCINTGAGLADLWRSLIIWEYGGIYTDIDNAPGPLFLNGELISHDMDSLFEVDKMGGFPSQYFFAASPHHPVTYYMVQHTISRLLEVPNIANQNVPLVTGPGATKSGVISTINNGYPKAGFYTGLYNRTVDIRGTRGRVRPESSYLLRSIVQDKKRIYGSMGMKFYGRQAKIDTKNKYKVHSCLHETYQAFHKHE